MKNLSLSLMAVLLMLAFLPNNLQAGEKTPKATTETVKTADPAQTAPLIARLDAIKAMDMSSMTKTEKKQMKGEARSIKATLNQMDGGVLYISGGTLLLVILLLVIFL